MEKEKRFLGAVVASDYKNLARMTKKLTLMKLIACKDDTIHHQKDKKN